MKTNKQLMELSFCIVCALAPLAVLTLYANPAVSPAYASARADSDREPIQGKVTARTDASLFVNGKMIGLTAGTTFMKDGKPIASHDVMVGDKVKVKVLEGTDGMLQATSVEVLTKKNASASKLLLGSSD